MLNHVNQKLAYEMVFALAATLVLALIWIHTESMFWPATGALLGLHAAVDIARILRNRRNQVTVSAA